MSDSIRSKFEAANPVPFGIFWSDPDSRYMTSMVHLNCLEYQGKWIGWQSAVLAQEAGTGDHLEYPECSGDQASCPENEGYGCCNTPSGKICPGDGINQCKKCPAEPSQHPILKVLSDPQAMELVALKATVAQQAQLIEWQKSGGCKCQGCGITYRYDLIIPDSTWELIKPDGKPEGAGLLCPECIFNRAAALFTSPPAPVSVVLPEHRDSDLRSPTYGYARGWNAAIDKVKELNQ